MATTKEFNLVPLFLNFVKSTKSTYGSLVDEKFDTTVFKTFFNDLVEGENKPKIKLTYEGDGATFFPTKVELTYLTKTGSGSFVALEGTKSSGRVTPNLSFPKVTRIVAK